MLEWLRRIARHGVEAPDLAPRGGIERREVPAIRRKLGTAVADHDLVADHAWRDRQRAGDVVPGRRLGGPHRRAGLRIERHEPAVDDRHEDLTLVKGEPAIDHAAADTVGARRRDPAIDLRVVAPQFLPVARIERNRHAPVRDHVHHAARDEGCGLLGQGAFADQRRPDAAEACHVRRVDLRERTEARLGRIEAVGRPIR
jgi:hypothetical protein